MCFLMKCKAPESLEFGGKYSYFYKLKNYKLKNLNA